jgi:polysaccharide biosynthesis protein PslG
MRRNIVIGIVLCLLAVPAAAAGKLDRDQIKSWLVKELKARGLAADKVSACKPNADHKVYKCTWHAEGEWPGEVPYECHGHARYDVKARDWWVSACHNRIPAEIPLNPEPGPRPLFGFNQDWFYHQNLLPQAKLAGSDVARQALAWNGVERTPGDYNWASYDLFYASAMAAGERPLFTLLAAPCWAQAHPKACYHGHNRRHPSPAHYDDAADFMLAAARRYPGAVGLEVWNEPNWKAFWGSDPDPRAWGRLVKAVAARVHSDPAVDVPVVSGGPAPFGSNRASKTNMPQHRFLAKAYKTGGPQASDAIGAHPYPYRPWRDDYVGSVRAKLEEIDDVMRHRGDADKPIWVTETGVSTDNGFTRVQQGKALAAIYRMLRRVTHPIPVVIFHRFADTRGHFRGGIDHFGIIDSDGKRKPAYCAVVQVLGLDC